MGKEKEMFPVNTGETNVVPSEGGRLALGRDENTYIFDDESSPILKYPISWSGHPVCIVDDPPYFLAMMPSSEIEVRAVEQRLLLQKIPDLLSSSTSKAKQLVKCLNEKGNLIVSSSKVVFCIVAQEILQLLLESHYELSLQLAFISEEKEADSCDSAVVSEKQIKNLQAFDNFCKKEFQMAMQLFLKLQTDPSHVIGLFPDLLPDDYRNRIEYPCKPPELRGQDLEKGIFALIDYLVEVRRQLYSSTDISAHLGEERTAKTLSKSREQLRQIVDTTLLKCYLQTNDALVSPLLRLPGNHCHLEETERALKKHSKHNELIILYQNKGLHRKALETLNVQSKKQNFGNERTVQYLHHLGKHNLDLIFEYASWLLKKHGEVGLKIFIEDRAEIEQLPRD